MWRSDVRVIIKPIMNKVLIEVGPMVDQNKSGVGHYVESLVYSLADNNTGYLMVGYYFNFWKLNKVNLPNIKNLHLHQIWLIPGKILSICRRFGFQPFLEIFLRPRADFIIFTNYVSLPLISNRRKQALVVYDLCFLDYPDFIQNVNLTYLSRFCPPSIKRADLIITISEFTKSRIQHFFPDIKAPIIITPIPPQKTINQITKENDRLKGLGIISKRYILFIGTLEPRKNIQNLMRAYINIGKDLCDTYSLVLAGGRGWKDEQIIQDIETHRDSGFNIITPGYITDDEKAYLYKNAACFVLPSHYEGFGMPILEAMQYNTPVAISDIDVFREVAGDAALYFDKDSPEDITRKICSLLTNAKIVNKLTNKGKERLKQFSWQDNARKIIGAIEEIESKD